MLYLAGSLYLLEALGNKTLVRMFIYFRLSEEDAWWRVSCVDCALVLGAQLGESEF